MNYHGWHSSQIDQLGSLGVHLFFGLSGYLIGKILLEVSLKPTLSTWFAFMVKRWKRTIPLYLVIISLLWSVSPPDSDLRQHFIQYVTLTDNITHAGFSNFGVAWSLAVEEAFYLVFSAVIFLACKIFGKHAQIPVISFFVLAPLVARLTVTGYSDHSVIYVLDALALGVLSARFSGWLSALSVSKALVASISLITLSQIGLYAPTDFTLESVGCCLLVIPSLSITSLWWFKIPVLQMAKLSYGLYLIHIPLMASCFQLHTGVIVLFFEFAIFANLVHVFIEKPCMRELNFTNLWHTLISNSNIAIGLKGRVS
jgi:peptidoglycan/LPS O-acetylase OafA/YrhL